MKKRPPKMRARVVPTEPETGTPLSVAGMRGRPLSVAVADGLAVALGDAVADALAGVGVGVVGGNGLPEPNGCACASSCEAGSTTKFTVFVTTCPVAGSV